MNRRTELFDDRLADWLEDDPMQAPPQVLETVLAAVPSIPQRRAGIAWRPGPIGYPWQLAAAAIVVMLFGILGLLVLRGPSIGPHQSPTPPAGLPDRIDVPLRMYSVNLPSGWSSALRPGPAGFDTYDGPEGRLEVALALVPPGSGQDEWADAYFSDQMTRPNGCPGIDPGAYEPARVGQETGRLYALPCAPGWMAMTAVGDRGYDVRFTVRGGTPEVVARTLFDRILSGMLFDGGPTPSLTLSTFTSSRFGFSIGYPTGWSVTEAGRDLGPFDTPWANAGEQVDLIEGPGTGMGPLQPSSGVLDAAATTPLPDGTTLQELANRTAFSICGPGTPDAVQVDGESALHMEFPLCYGQFHQWITAIHNGRGYHILWLDDLGTEGFDRSIFQQILATFRFSGAAATTAPTVAPTTAPSPAGDPVPDELIGAWYQAAPGWWWFIRAGDPECVQAVRTEGDCVVWQRGTTPKEIGAASMVDGSLQVAWRSGFCTGITSLYSVALETDSLNLVDIGGGCEGGNFALTRAGTGTTPTAPRPPAP